MNYFKSLMIISALSMPIAQAIVGGFTESKPNPWMLSLQTEGQHFCTGSILSISDNEILGVSAAHCIVRVVNMTKYAYVPKESIRVVANILDVNGAPYNPAKDKSVIMVVKNMVVRKEGHSIDMVDTPMGPAPTQSRVIPYDATLLHLAPADKFSKNNVKFLKSAQISLQVPNNAVLYTSGWGQQRSHSVPGNDTNTTIRLKTIKDVQLLPGKSCQVPPLEFPSFYICTTRPNATICHGDSGGPLYYYDAKGAPVLVGITSKESQVTCQPGSKNIFQNLTSLGKSTTAISQFFNENPLKK